MEHYQQSADELLKELETTDHGLSAAEAAGRLARFGPNSLPSPQVDGWGRIFIRQFQSPLIYLLLAAGAVVWFLGQWVDAVVIGAVLLINAVVGTIQEGRAQNTLLALHRLTESNATVLRDKRELDLDEREVVAGDVLLLQAGAKVVADARVLEATGFLVDEAALTGESEPVRKTSAGLPAPDLPVADQTNMIFKGTYALGGNARALAVATGERTILGKIAGRLKLIDTEIPLRADLRWLSRLVALVVFGLSMALFSLGVQAGLAVKEMFAVAVAIAVSAIPEGLPVAVTLVLASGVWRMSRQHALVKRLQAVEALGQATLIALDKTGTITRNQMMLDQLYVADQWLTINGNGYEPVGVLRREATTIEPLNHPEVLLAGKIALLTASAQVRYSEHDGEWRRLFGDPTEAALLVFGLKLGFSREDLVRENPLVLDLPFDPQTRYHGAIHLAQGRPVLYVAGAPEAILASVTSYWRAGRSEKITANDREQLARQVERISTGGGRALALAVNFAPPRQLTPGVLPELCLVGLAGLRDAVRPEVTAAVAAARGAGLKVVMITGDHLETARAVGREVGIYRSGDEIISGQELTHLDSEALAARLDRVSVFARVTPDHKLKIIEAYRRRGEIVAMTGDGVNDALSLTAADLGVAMGRVGTEVAKEAADIVLLDDNFGSIVAAINEGRQIYWSIKRILLYLFSTSLGEVLTVAGALLVGLSLPVNASQIIWLNLVTDGFLVLALALEPPGAENLSARRPTHRLLDGLMIVRIVLMGAVMMVGTLWLFDYYQGFSVLKASTVALTVLAVFQWFNALNCRSERRSILTGRRLTKWWGLVFGAVVVLQLAAVYTPWGQFFLRTAALDWSDWLLILGVSFLIVAVEETRKLLARLLFSRV